MDPEVSDGQGSQCKGARTRRRSPLLVGDQRKQVYEWSSSEKLKYGVVYRNYAAYSNV